MYEFCTSVLRRIHKDTCTSVDWIGTRFKTYFEFHQWYEDRIDTLVLIIYNYFIVFLIESKNMTWEFHPFRGDIIADHFGLVFERPAVLSKFGITFRWVTLVCSSLGLLPFIWPKKRYRRYLLPLIIWNVYTVTALVENILQTLISIVCLQVLTKVIVSVFVSGVFVTFFYLKLILQVLNFYGRLHLAE